jgi:hypothetical protein
MPHPLGGKYGFSVTIALSALIKMPFRLFKKHRVKCHRWRTGWLQRMDIFMISPRFRLAMMAGKSSF